MEPAEAPLTAYGNDPTGQKLLAKIKAIKVPETEFIREIVVQVKDIKEMFDQVYVSGFGPGAKFDYPSKGWFVQFEGSNESLRFGSKPALKVGDRVQITFERIKA